MFKKNKKKKHFQVETQHTATAKESHPAAIIFVVIQSSDMNDWMFFYLKARHGASEVLFFCRQRSGNMVLAAAPVLLLAVRCLSISEERRVVCWHCSHIQSNIRWSDSGKTNRVQKMFGLARTPFVHHLHHVQIAGAPSRLPIHLCLRTLFCCSPGTQRRRTVIHLFTGPALK